MAYKEYFLCHNGVNKMKWVKAMNNKEIDAYLDELTPEDVGYDDFGDLRVVFEGFTDECWEDAIGKGKTLQQIEKELLNDWKERYNGTVIESGWHTEDIFYAIFRLDVSKQARATYKRKTIDIEDLPFEEKTSWEQTKIIWRKMRDRFEQDKYDFWNMVKHEDFERIKNLSLSEKQDFLKVLEEGNDLDIKNYLKDEFDLEMKKANKGGNMKWTKNAGDCELRSVSYLP